MAIPWADELRDLINKVVNLTGNVASLQKDNERLSSEVNKLKEELFQLKADLRVARAELETEATKAAISTVVQTYDQITGRLQEIERRLPPPD